MSAHKHDSTKDHRSNASGERTAAGTKRLPQQDPSGLLALQCSVGNAAVVRMIQRTDGIADRVRQRNNASRAHSPRLREQAAGGRGQPSYTDAPERGFWDGNSRFPYRAGVQDNLFNPLLDAATGLYNCPRCNKQVPRHPARPSDNYITVEHKIPFRQWIMDHAEPDQDGKITTDAASKAYSDESNLQALCRDCNSSLGGDQNTFV
ncbi:hypothetical protein ABTZ03_40865 [Kitasatospora sp. NPDC096077]|uniref:hypothetical protein n=1 Tax=Kitasatospora sp. NPDC096077 TaxID=3155544 RepID=UPI00331BEA99